MSAAPVVSIIMPCFNAEQTLPWAIASLQAQTFEDWECIVVDDGSTDASAEIARALGDSRVKVIKLERNRGRGAARQIALEHASGEYLAMLDADDWLYPSKLARQVEALDSEPKFSLVSAGMAIVDVDEMLVGIRCRGPLSGSYRKPVMPPVAFGPSMLRMDIARNIGFDSSLGMSEDIDLLIAYLLGKEYLLLPDVVYAYREFASVTLKKAVVGFQSLRAIHRKYHRRYPFTSLRNTVREYAKESIYRGAFTAGLGRVLVSRRSAPAALADLLEYDNAREAVGLVFGGRPSPVEVSS